MIRIKHIGPDGRIAKTIDITPETSDKDVKAALDDIKLMRELDMNTGNTLGIIAKPVPPKEEVEA